MSSYIRIVLIKTWHSGNIGAAARAMKNMGLTQLVLVDPVDFPSNEATSRAGQATDVLENARVVETLDQAIEDCSLVIGTSARNRTIPLPSLSAEQSAVKALSEQGEAETAFVFGRERMGLLNEEIQKCHFQLNIDANPEYPVLNLSQAVQLVCYELFKASQTTPTLSEEPYPRHKEFELFLNHLETVAEKSGFINSQHPGQMMDHLRAMFRRARMTQKELSIMRGLLKSVER